MDEGGLGEALQRNGFVILDILNKEEISYLNKLADKFLPSTAQDFVSSSHFLSLQDSGFINDELHKIIAERMNRLFPDLQLLGGTLATKNKNKAVLKAHNDWSIVDETKYDSYNLWVALCDTSSQNGTLGLIVGSHHWKPALRGLNIEGNYEAFTKQFIEIGYEPALKAGQAILYNHKLIHYSRPNQTEQPRNVAIIGMKDKQAALQVSFCLDGNTIETYQAAQDDFYGFNAESIRNNNKQLSKIPLVKNQVSWQDIYAEFRSNLPEEFSYLAEKRKSVFAKLLDKLKFAD